MLRWLLITHTETIVLLCYSSSEALFYLSIAICAFSLKGNNGVQFLNIFLWSFFTLGSLNFVLIVDDSLSPICSSYPQSFC